MLLFLCTHMKLDRTLLTNENFKLTEHEIAGELCTFVRPVASVFDVWNEQNLIYRSSIWNSEGDLISASFPKFFNLPEKPDLNPFSGKLEGCSLTEKIDGSCLIVSKYKGKLILRTRGTVSAFDMPNWSELVDLKLQYKKLFDELEAYETFPFTFLFEWVSPENRIIIGYGADADLYLTNIVEHETYLLAKQVDLDSFAADYGLKRPPRHSFNTLEELLANVEKWEGKEGICLYYDNDQHIRKVKGAWYLKLHAFKANCNVNSLLDLYFSWNKPNAESFMKTLEEVFDYECVRMSGSVVDHIYTHGINPALEAVQKINEFVFDEDVVGYDQKSFAIRLKAHFPDKVYQSIGFAIRKNATYEKSFRTLIEQKIKEYKEESSLISEV